MHLHDRLQMNVPLEKGAQSGHPSCKWCNKGTEVLQCSVMPVLFSQIGEEGMRVGAGFTAITLLSFPQ